MAVAKMKQNRQAKKKPGGAFRSNRLILKRRFLARPTRLERVTYGLEGRCSIHLS
jgi:hypothetical protein